MRRVEIWYDIDRGYGVLLVRDETKTTVMQNGVSPERLYKLARQVYRDSLQGWRVTFSPFMCPGCVGFVATYAGRSHG